MNDYKGEYIFSSSIAFPFGFIFQTMQDKKLPPFQQWKKKEDRLLLLGWFRRGILLCSQAS
jgi:hypothetical protein